MNLAEARRLLNVSPEDSPELIKTKWRQASLDNHPDRNSGDFSASEATRRQQNINLAYDILRGRAAADPPPTNPSGSQSRSHSSSKTSSKSSTKPKPPKQPQFGFARYTANDVRYGTRYLRVTSGPHGTGQVIIDDLDFGIYGHLGLYVRPGSYQFWDTEETNMYSYMFKQPDLTVQVQWDADASWEASKKYFAKRLGPKLLRYSVVFGLGVITLGFSTATFLAGLIVFGVIRAYMDQ